jgi:hypothetical protein
MVLLPNRGRTRLLELIEIHFHELIRHRAGELLPEAGLELPSLKKVPIREARAAWFPVPGMYGGFKYWLDEKAAPPRLICESWCRVVDGSGQRHVVDAEGYHLVDEGFV